MARKNNRWATPQWDETPAPSLLSAAAGVDGATGGLGGGGADIGSVAGLGAGLPLPSLLDRFVNSSVSSASSLSHPNLPPTRTLAFKGVGRGNVVSKGNKNSSNTATDLDDASGVSDVDVDFPPLPKPSSKPNFAINIAGDWDEAEAGGDVANSDNHGDSSLSFSKTAAAFTNSVVDRIRKLVHDALAGGMDSSACFWAEKLPLTELEDVNFLATVYFKTRQFARACHLLKKPFLTAAADDAPSVATASNNSNMSGINRSNAGSNTVESKPRYVVVSVSGGQPSVRGSAPTSFLRSQRFSAIQVSLGCRALAARCMIERKEWDEALEVVKESNEALEARLLHLPPQQRMRSEKSRSQSFSIFSFVRGNIFLHLDNRPMSAENFKLCLSQNPANFEALDALLQHNMLTGKEEWELLDAIDFSKIYPSDPEFFRSLYAIRLSKTERRIEQQRGEQQLENFFAPVENTDVLCSRAQRLYLDSNFEQSFDLTTKILNIDPFNESCLSLHIANQFELGLKNKLFYFVHKLVDNYPHRAVTWYGVGCYYLLVGKNDEARRYFSKATTWDISFGPAWLAFGHSFAIEGEHDQAIAAYSTAARLFNGSHLPSAYIGMEHSSTFNIPLAEQYLMDAVRICETDALVLNELGVVYFRNGEFQKATEYLTRALKLSSKSKWRKEEAEAIYLNLGHAHRKLSHFDKAIFYLKEALNSNPQAAGTCTSLGFAFHLSGDLDQAISYYHQALTLNVADAIADELLKRALGESLLAPFKV